MIKKIGSLMVTLLALALLVYSATRSMDFIALTLPNDKQILAYFALAALDGGLIAWLLSYLYGSRGAWQRAISLLMVIVDLLGAVAMFTFDALYRSAERGLIAGLSPETVQATIIGLSLIIALNIAATVAHHLADPERIKMQAEEEAFARIEEATLRQIARNAEQLAAEVAPVLASAWQAQTRARYLSYVGGKLPSPEASKVPQAVPEAVRSNGHVEDAKP
jgi:hypothetical protein